MMNRASAADDSRTLTVRVPMVVRKRGGRRLVVTSDGTATVSKRLQIDNAMVKALARAFRWRKLLERGTYATVAEITKAEGVNNSYVSRILRLTLLAPDIVEAVIDGRHGETMTVQTLTRPFPVEWAAQRHDLAAADTSIRCVGHRVRRRAD